MAMQADVLVMKNQRLVHHVLKKLWIRPADYSEYAAAGMLGLVEASRRFVPPEDADETGAAKAFASYAYWYILRRAVEVLGHTRPISLTSTRAGRFLSVYFGKITRKIEKRGETVTAETVSNEVGLPLNVVEELLPLFTSTLPHNVLSVREPENELDRMAVDVADGTPSSEEDMSRSERIRAVREVLDMVRPGLDPMEQVLLDERFLEDDGKTCQEIGDDFGVTRQRVSQKHLALKAKLRKKIEAAGVEL